MLTKAQTKFDRVDVISTLKRAVDIRIKDLNSKYQLRRMPLSNMPKRTTDVLATVGILRPLMVDKLMTIRNQVEHHDSDPPSLAQCSELVDFPWYFFRSTDDSTEKRLFHRRVRRER
ncbi:MAG: hypothetical protein ABIG63_16980 [Chloroflexota bacterium]